MGCRDLCQSENYSYLEELKAYLYTIGVRNWRIFTIFPVGRAANHPEFQLTDEEFTGVLEFIKKVRKEGRVHLSYGCEGFLGKYESEVRDHFYSCNAGISVASVLADGSISSCPSIRSNFHQGNIYEDDFMEVWENVFRYFVIVSGPVRESVLIVAFSVIVRAMVCICTMTMETSCFVIRKGL